MQPEGAGQADAPELESHSAAEQRQATEEGGGGGSGPAAEARSIYRRLAEVDPMRKGYYEDAAAGKAYVVLRALGTA